MRLREESPPTCISWMVLVSVGGGVELVGSGSYFFVIFRGSVFWTVMVRDLDGLISLRPSSRHGIDFLGRLGLRFGDGERLLLRGVGECLLRDR